MRVRLEFSETAAEELELGDDAKPVLIEITRMRGITVVELG
jgi:hypothetical protein